MKAAGLILLLGLAGLAGFTWIKARLNTARAEAAFPPEGQLFEVDGQQVHAVVMGDGPAVVFLHGSSGNARDFTHSLVQKLAREFRVIVFDRPGLGYSDPLSRSGATINEQAAFLARAAAELGAERPVVVGHSYGGAVALAWAVHAPDNISGLVLLGAPSQPWTSPLGRRYKLLSHPVTGPVLATVMNAFVGQPRIEEALGGIFEPQSPPDGYGDHVGPGLTLRRGSLRANALQRANLLDEIIALQPQYPSITVPTEIVHGTADTTVGLEIHAEPLAAQIPDARLTPLDGIGHMPQHAAQPDVIAAIRRAAGN